MTKNENLRIFFKRNQNKHELKYCVHLSYSFSAHNYKPRNDFGKRLWFRLAVEKESDKHFKNAFLLREKRVFVNCIIKN